MGVEHRVEETFLEIMWKVEGVEHRVEETFLGTVSRVGVGK